MKLCAALLLGHVSDRRLIGNAGGIIVAEELYVPAERNGGNFPPRAMTIVEAEKLGAEPDRKNQDLDAAPAGDQEMAELVEEHHERQNEQKGNKRCRARPSPAC